MPALGASNAETASLEVYIFDSEIEGFCHPQATAVEQPSNEIGWLRTFIANFLQEPSCFVNRGSTAELNGLLGAECVHVANHFSQHFSVEKQKCVEGLILSAGRDIAAARQLGEEMFDLLLAGKAFGHLTQRPDVTMQPEGITIFSGKCFMLSPEYCPHLLNCL